MMTHPEFQLTKHDIQDFATKGFVRLRKLLAPKTIDMLRQIMDNRLESSRDLDWYGSLFNRTQFDFANDDEDVLALCQDPVFSRALTQVTQHALLYTQSVGWELKKNQDEGLSWHVDTISFGYQPLDQFGCSIWVPMVRIEKERQGGGISCVPMDLFSGRCMFQYGELLSSHVRKMQAKGTPLSSEAFAELEYRLIDTSELTAMLDAHAETEDFEVGDVFVFDKHVLHRSCPLTEGPIDVRGAFTMRFMDAKSTYDLKRAHSMVPYQEGLHYDHQTAYSLNISKEDGALLVESPLFEGTRGRRVLPLT